MNMASGGLIGSEKPIEATVYKGEYVIPKSTLLRVFGPGYRKLFGLS